MVSNQSNTLRPLPFKYPAERTMRGSYTFSEYAFLWTNVSSIATSLTLLIPGYIGEFEEVDDHRSGKIVIQLNGRSESAMSVCCSLLSSCSINKTGVISPRYNVRIGDFEKWVVKLLPSRQFGYIVLTTSSGIMDHEEARRKHVAGKVEALESWRQDFY